MFPKIVRKHTRALNCYRYFRKEVMVWQQGDGEEPRRQQNM